MVSNANKSNLLCKKVLGLKERTDVKNLFLKVQNLFSSSYLLRQLTILRFLPTIHLQYVYKTRSKVAWSQEEKTKSVEIMAFRPYSTDFHCLDVTGVNDTNFEIYVVKAHLYNLK